MAMKARVSTVIGFALLLFVALFAAGCLEETSSVDDKQQVQQERSLSEMNRQVGMPEIANFQEKKLFKAIIELRDRADLVTYAYLKSEYTGRLIYLGKAIGFGVPAATQYTNPERIDSSFGGDGRVSLPQADPNGLFMPSSTAATWLMLIDPATGKPVPFYCEVDLIVSLFKVSRRACDQSSLPSDY
jgi:hypothetical protein